MPKYPEKIPGAETLLESLNTDLPPEVAARMQAHLDDLRTQMNRPPATPARSADTRRHRRYQLGALAGLCLGVLVVIAFLAPLTSRTALAQIADAVSKKNWLHAVGTGPGGQRAEMWFSARQGIVGFVNGESVVLVDRFQRTMDVYGPPAPQGSIQRLPVEHMPSGGLDAARNSFASLLGGNIQQAMQGSGQQILEQSSKSVEANGRSLIEYRFLVSVDGDKQHTTTNLLLVDAASSLPVSWAMKIADQQYQYKIEYPAQGPLTIVALGVPADAKRVNLAPEGDFKHILTATRAMRKRFDDYHAIVIESMSENRGTGGLDGFQIWRKGNLWRVDQLRLTLGTLAKAPADADPEVWWLQQARLMKSFPREIWDGRRIYNFEPQYPTPRERDSDDPQFTKVVSLKSTVSPPFDATDAQSRWHMLHMPDFYGYEHLTRGASLGFRAELRPGELQSQSVTIIDIIRTLNTSPNTISPERYWLDENLMMVRKEQFRASAPQTPTGRSEVTAIGRTPQGLPYPMTVRLAGNTISMETGVRSDSFVHYFLAFDEVIPDELFDAEHVDLKQIWTGLK